MRTFSHRVLSVIGQLQAQSIHSIISWLHLWHFSAPAKTAEWTFGRTTRRCLWNICREFWEDFNEICDSTHLTKVQCNDVNIAHWMCLWKSICTWIKRKAKNSQNSKSQNSETVDKKGCKVWVFLNPLVFLPFFSCREISQVKKHLTKAGGISEWRKDGSYFSLSPFGQKYFSSLEKKEERRA